MLLAGPLLTVSLAAIASVPAAPGLVTVPGTSAVVGAGPVRRFAIDVERGVRVDPRTFADAAQGILLDPRGWTGGGRLALQRVDSGLVDVRVTLARPRTVDRLCFPLHTAGFADCFNHGRAVINVNRWTQGTVPYAGALGDYRDYLINHEVGHGLGHGHRLCPGAGRRSFVMMQQTGTTFGCRRQPWPRVGEQRAALVPPRVVVVPGPSEGATAGVAFLQALGAPDRRLDVRVLPGPSALSSAALKGAAAVVFLDTPVPLRGHVVRRFTRAGGGVVGVGAAAADPTAAPVCRREAKARMVLDGAGSLAADWLLPGHQALVAGGIAWALGLTDSRPC